MTTLILCIYNVMLLATMIQRQHWS